ncbi:MAG: PTS transporter subunit IIC [Mycoplasmataceae bacterium]|nr:PTS transporter subunit IIC [Mycoplasmataceae bacterium]
MSAGEWFLSFFKDFIGTPAILIGLFAMLGSILLRKSGTQIIMSFFKTAAGFLIIGGGAGVLVGSLINFQLLFTDLFNVNGVIPNNDGFAGSLFESFPSIAQLGSIIMVLAMALNILLAATSRFKYIYLSGHVLFYMSIMISGVMVLGAGLDLENYVDYSVALISSGLILSIYMVLSAASNKKYVQRITKTDDITIGHTGSMGYLMSGLIGDLIYKLKKGKNIKSTEDIKFPKGLQFFRNTFASMAITMLIVFAIVYIPEGIMYNTGLKLLPPGEAGVEIGKIFGSNSVNWLVRCVLDAFTFAAGVEIILYGVRMAIGELVPAFKGISDKLVKDAKAAIDCPIVFPYAPNAVLIGFLSSMMAGIIGIGLTLAVRLANPAILPVIIPGIIAHFFLGATSGVFGNSKGGVWGAVIGSFVHGLIITFVPVIFIAGGWSPSKDLGWGDTDYLIGIIPGLIGFIDNPVLMRTLIILIPSILFGGLVADGLMNKYIFKPKNDSKNDKVKIS